MDISTLNVIIGAAATTIGAAVLFVLGAILQYVRSISRNMKELYEKSIMHGVKLEDHEKRIEQMDDKIYKLNRTNP